MAKSLSERIAQRAAGARRGGKNLASFLAVRDDVKEALQDGWAVKVIWRTLHDEGKITFSYDAFNNYVNRLIQNADTPAPLRARPSSPPASPAKNDADKKNSGEIPTFKFNPKPPNLKDLL
jgi:hypothetical protein